MKIARNALDLTIESLRFEDENEFLYEMYLKGFCACSQRYAGKEVEFSPDSKRLKFLTFDNLFPPLRNSHYNS